MPDDWMQAIHNVNPYVGFPVRDFMPDLQGWGHDSPIFEHVISLYHPSKMIEVGTWKGASAIKIADLMKRYYIPNAQLVCVDTWLGSVELWTDPRYAPDLRFKWGRPELYSTFVANVIRSRHTDVIVPFPVDASTAAKFFDRKDMIADAIYLDASHEYEDVAADLRAYWKVLRPGGVFFGDDYAGYWPGLVEAVNEFALLANISVDTSFPTKFLFCKPK